MNLWVIFFTEVFLIAGGLVGFVVSLNLFLNKEQKSKPERLKKKTITPPKEKPSARKNAKKSQNSDSSISLSSRIPSKASTLTDINCSFEGTDENVCLENNRAQEDGAYEILRRRKGQ